FTRKTIFRFATLDLVRNQWRQLTRPVPTCINEGTGDLVVDAVNIEEHTDRVPFRYDIPLGIQRERITSSTYQDVFQNEQSLSLKYLDLQDGCERKVYKNLDLDLRVFKNVQMFVHSEETDMINDPVPDGATKLFMRFGSDFDNNYYEYEVPLVQSKDPTLTGDAYKKELWRTENEVQFSLEELTNLKIERNAANFPLTDVYEKTVTQVIDGIPVERTFRIRGNPTLGYVRNVIIGIRNPVDGINTGPYNGEVWVNELRVVGLEEKGGVAGLARVDATLADFGTLGLSGTYSSIGWGAIDQKLDDRAKESVSQLDFSTNLQLGKFFGQHSKVQVPFYYQYSQTVRKPKYDALDLDLLLKQKLDGIQDQHTRDSVKEISQDYSSLRQISFTNVRKEPKENAVQLPWNLSNFTVSYSNSRSFIRNEVLEKDELKENRGSLDYTYSVPLKPIQPLKNLSKSNWLKWLTEFNINPLPSSFTFGTVMDRKFGERDYRFSDLIYKTWFDKRFTWDRTYALRWDLTKSIKINFNAANAAVIDEPDEFLDRENYIRIPTKVRNDSIWHNIKKFGRTKDYTHQLRVTYSVPFKNFPILDWIRTDLSYDASYGWKAASINTDSLGNIIQNGQNRQLSGELDFVKLYNKVPLLAKINKPTSTSSQRGSKAPVKKPDQNKPDDPNNPDKSKGKTKDEKKPSTAVSPALKAVLRPIMMVRKFRLNYGENMSTIIPGFTPKSRLLGMSRGFDAPGWSFIAGLQPDINRSAYQKDGDWLAKARDNAWITTNAFQNQPVLQTKATTIDSRLSLEPFNDFKIDVDFSRNLSKNFSVFFKTYHKTGNTLDSIQRASPREVGTYSISYFSVPTLFMGDSLELNQLFSKFESNRSIISKLRGIDEHTIDGPDYAEGFGRKQQDVLIPAFIAAYTGKDPKNFEFTDMFDWLPRPNWTVSYNGLSKLPMFKNIFSNVRISHGYKSTLTINQFESDLSYHDYDPNTGQQLGQRNPGNLDTLSANYYSQFLVPSVVIEEAFNPLIGIDVKLKNDMNFNFSYAKRRSLSMGFISYELAETRSTTVDFGFDWKLKNVRLGFLPGFNSMANKKKSSGNKPGEVQTGNDLSILFDFSFADNITLNHLLDQKAGARATRGSKDITISPSLSYDVNKNVNLRFFVDYRRQNPYVSNSYIVVNTNGGLTVKIKLE
ncbi:MAG TPA: cell surface protein SprA, partial [Saprospiraceae bacterium]|nr:cell surface protein SprA [Saprospiraceae bacterium]